MLDARTSHEHLRRVVTMAKNAGVGMVFVGAVLAAAVGPRFTWPSSSSGSFTTDRSFTYTPPPGFVPAEGESWKAIQAASPAVKQAWFVPANPEAVLASRPTVNVMHAPRMEPVEPPDLEAIAAGMPALVAANGSTWKTVRVAREVRRDGARVGWIEGECERDGLKYHSLELVFPDDDGTSFVTAMAPSDQMDKWTPLFEASVQSATGVARRFGPPPLWMHLAWAAGGALLALLASGIVQRRERRRGSASMPARGSSLESSAPSTPSPAPSPAAVKLPMYEGTDPVDP